MPSEPACATCGARLTGRWCSNCGERARKPGEVSLREYLAEFAEAAVNLDGRFLGSLRRLIFRPGLLTIEYMAGRRVCWMRPLHLFLLINLLFFLLAGGWTAFSTPLQVHMTVSGFPHQSLALDWVNRHLNEPALEKEQWSAVIQSATGGELELDETAEQARERLIDYTRQFNRRTDITARSLIIALVPLATLFPMLAFIRRRESVVKHLVFATHWTTTMILFLLISGWITLLAIQSDLLPAHRDDLMASSISGGLVLAWSTAAFRKVYATGWVVAILTGLGMLVWWGLFIQLYRSLLFFVVFWTL